MVVVVKVKQLLHLEVKIQLLEHLIQEAAVVVHTHLVETMAAQE
jgi:hypothetical protein